MLRGSAGCTLALILGIIHQTYQSLQRYRDNIPTKKGKSDSSEAEWLVVVRHQLSLCWILGPVSTHSGSVINHTWLAYKTAHLASISPLSSHF